MLLQPERVKDGRQIVIERLCQLFPHLKTAQELALDFARMVKRRVKDHLPEWQVNRLKLIKRMMYRQARFDLLRARVLNST